LGVYATATVMAAARTREMGIRLAVGASGEQIGRLVLWRSIRLALLALPVGASGAWGLGVCLAHWLFQVGATDPVSYVTSAVVLLAIALAAGLWPAIQAARTDPLTALRCDG
jgi:ABC-type antimicrobial peptide transport system permease subunit